jgi:hypothetical protein
VVIVEKATNAETEDMKVIEWRMMRGKETFLTLK